MSVKTTNKALATLPVTTLLGHQDEGGGNESLVRVPIASLLLPGVAVRGRLTASRIYYVRADGSDANTGFVDNAGGAFLTIQRAIDAVQDLDLATHDVEIRVRSGTFAPLAISGSWVGNGLVSLLGDFGTPANCVIHATAEETDAVLVDLRGQLFIGGFRLISDEGNLLHSSTFSAVDIVGPMEYGAAAEAHLRCDNNALIFAEGQEWEIIAGAERHFSVDSGGIIKSFDNAVTVTGTPAFDEFARAEQIGTLITGDTTFTGSATGQRYLVATNSVIDTDGGGANYFPGDVAGADETGGQYL